MQKDLRVGLGGGQTFLTFIRAIVEDVEGIYCLFTPLLVTKNQINPLMEVTGHVFTLLKFKMTFIVILTS